MQPFKTRQEALDWLNANPFAIGSDVGYRLWQIGYWRATRGEDGIWRTAYPNWQYGG